MLDETKVRALQSAYLITRHPHFLFHFQQEVQSLIQNIIFYKTSKSGYYMDEDRIQELSWDASTRFIEQYLKRSSYSCQMFSTRLNSEALYALYNRKRKSREKFETRLFDTIEIKEPEYKEDTRWVLEDLKSDTEHWKRLFIDCYKAKSYKSFLLKASEYVSVRWITDHQQRLKKLYRHTRISR